MSFRSSNPIKMAAGVLLAAILAYLILRQPASDPKGSDTSSLSEEGKRGTELPANSRERDRRAADPEKAAHILELERLEGRWLEIETEAKSGVMGKESMDLVRESAEHLLCSQETLRLFEFLSRKGMGDAKSAVEEAIPTLFSSDFASQARASVAALSQNATGYTMPFVKKWAYYAASKCSEEEFEAFRDSLGSEEALLSASLGRNLQLAKTDPAAALASTLELLKSSSTARDGNSGQMLQQMIDDMPKDANFQELEMLLPAPGSKDGLGKLTEVREDLLKKWASVDPAGAANHVMEHPERVSPEAIESITYTVLETNYAGGLEWIQTFPDGPYKDAAALAVVERNFWRKPDLAFRFAALIQDPALRAECLKRISDAQSNTNENSHKEH